MGVQRSGYGIHPIHVSQMLLLKTQEKFVPLANVNNILVFYKWQAVE